MASYGDCPGLLRDFLFYIKTIKGRSERTVDSYHIDLRLFLRYIRKLQSGCKDAVEEIDITAMTPQEICAVRLSDVYEFLEYTLSGRANNARTRARKVSSIRSFYNYISVNTNYLAENPVKNLETASIRKSLPKYLTLEESLELLVSVPPKEHARDYCILTLFLNCGMRLSELVGINTTDIRGDTLRLLGKGDKERIIYLNDACKAAIAGYLASARPIPKRPEDKNALFLSRMGTRITTRRVEQIVEACLNSAGLGGMGYSPHKLRHTAATLMYQHGEVDIRALKEILGHVSISTTEIYTHVSSKQLEKAANASPLAKITNIKKDT